MKVTSATARRFSESLLRVYAAENEASVQDALASAEQLVGMEGRNHWLVGLLRGHAEHRREQLRRGATRVPAKITSLTVREQEVLQRVALGETDAAIGRMLEISPKTASKHLENILRKLGVETRTAAAAAVHTQRPRT